MNKFLSIVWILYVSCNTVQKHWDKITAQTKSSVVVNDSLISDDFVEKEKNILSHLANLRLQSINDSARWNLYNIYCDYKLPTLLIDSAREIFLSYLDLKPIYFEISNDKKYIDIFYSFIYKGKLVSNFIVPPDPPIAKGVKIDINTKKVISYIDGRAGYFTIKKTTVKSIIQPHLPFLSTTSSHLNLWFRNALLKHGIKF